MVLLRRCLQTKESVAAFELSSRHELLGAKGTAIFAARHRAGYERQAAKGHGSHTSLATEPIWRYRNVFY